MRKWLVGLLAAGLCISSAWADDVLTRETTGVTGASYTDWTATGDSGAEYAGNSAGSNESIQLRSDKKTSGIVITKAAGSDVSSVTVDWNENTVDGRAIQIYGSATAYASPADLYGDAKGTLLGEIAKGETSLDVEGYPFIGIRSKNGALYLTSVTIAFGGEKKFSVTFDKKNWFEVDQGTASSVTAIAKNGTEPYTYEWSCDQSELLTGTEATLAIPDTLEAGDYSLFCMVKDADLNAINAGIGLRVVAPKAKFPVTVAEGIEHGTVTVDKEEAIEGETVTVTATAESGYKLDSLTYNGTPISGNTFAMPAEAVEVNATFVEKPAVSGDELTRETTGVTGSSYTEWTATGESGAKYAGQSAGGNESIQLRAQSPAGIVITESSGSDVASVTVEWNDATAEKRSLEIYGSTTAYAGPADLYGDGKGTLLGTIARTDTTLEVSEGYPYVGILAKGGALYLTSVVIDFAGEAGLSVSLDKANGFTVGLGTADSITATAKNGVEPYTYAWTSDTPDLNGTGATLAIPATLAEGDYTVQVEVTDAEANKANKQIYFSVVAPLEPHAININVGIQNGTVTSDPEGEAVKGTQVKLTATATTEGYALQEMTVTYGETVLTFTASPATFEMPDEAVSVGAVFAEVKDYAELPFVAEDTPYSGPWKGATVDGLTSKGLGTDYGDGSARLDSTGDWLQVKFAGTPGTLSYGIKGNSVSADNPSTFLVQESADGETWSPLATYVSGDNLGDKTEASHELSASSQFVRFFYETKGAGNVGIYDVYITSGGPAVFSITLDPAKDFEVEQNAEAFVTAIPKHAAEGVVGYAWWIDGTPVDTAGEVLALATAELGPHKVICEATDAAGAKADAHVIYTVVAPAVKYQIECAVGIPNGSVTADKTEAEEGELVTLTAKPDAGYKLEHFLLDGIAFTENPFPMPAKDVLVSASFVEITGETFTLVESAEDFEEGADYLIVAYSKDKFTSALKNEPSDKRIAVDEVVISEEKTVVTDSDAIVWTISAGAEGKYTLYNAAKGVYAAAPTGASANEARLLEDGTDETAQWTIDIAEDALVTIGSLHEGKALQRNSTAANAYFANYKSGTKPFLFKKAGPASPKIVYSGETSITLGESFSIAFGLLNYDGEYEWVLDSREGGSIAPDGEYTWTPTEAGDVTIKVVARNGELDIASKEVALTVAAAPGKPELVIAGDDKGVVGTTVNFTVTPTGFSTSVLPELGNFEPAEGSELTKGDITFDWPNVSFIPDAAGVYAFDFSAGVSGDEYAEGSWTVTVSDEPVPPPTDKTQIMSMSFSTDAITLEFNQNASAIYGSKYMSVPPAEWGPVTGVEFGDKSAKVPLQDGPLFLRAE